MPRIRTIKPEFWTDGDMLKISRDARLFYIGLWNFADDNGVVEGDPLALKARVFPCDDIDIQRLLQELESVRKVMLYNTQNSDTKPWILIKSFMTHQLIDRPRKSNNPLPSEDQLKSVGFQLMSRDIMVGREGKGKEGKVKEGSVRYQQSMKVIELLNKTCHTRYEPTNQLSLGIVSARFDEGATLEDFEAIITHKAETWGNDNKMKEFIRPKTLFSKGHWEDYLNAAKRKPKRRSDV